MMGRRLFSILLAVMFLLASCGVDQGGAGTGDTTEISPDTAPAAIDLDGYTVIRPDAAGFATDAAISLRNSLVGAGTDVGIASDWIRDPSTLPETAKEILVGGTNRKESAEVTRGITEGKYVIKVFDSGRIAIAGGSADDLEAAVAKFLSLCAEGALTEGYELSVTGKEHRLTRVLLNSADLCDYSVYLPSGDRDLLAAAFVFSRVIADATGLSVPTVRKEPDSGKYIKLEKTGSLIATAAGEKGITLSAPGGYIVSAARELARRIVPEESSGELSVVIASSTEALPEKESVPEAALKDMFGEIPVVLTDQQNAEAAVYDIAPVLSGGSPALTYTFKPTSSLGYNTGNTYKNSIDEFKVRYSSLLETFVGGFTSSAGYIGLAELPSGKCLWEVQLSGYGPHSIEYLPWGDVVVALSGNGDETKSCIRLYPVSNGKKNSSQFREVDLDGAHAVVWDDVRGVLWALGSKVIKAFEIERTGSLPVLAEIGGYSTAISIGGHDLTALDYSEDSMLLCGKGCLLFSKSTGSLTAATGGALSTASSKCICSMPLSDGGMLLLETVATGVYKSHDTDYFKVYVIPSDSSSAPFKAASGARTLTLKFDGRAFYKARAVRPLYS
jgi:hypothetical protein